MYEESQISGPVHQILEPNENMYLTWECRKPEFTVNENNYGLQCLATKSGSLSSMAAALAAFPVLPNYNKSLEQNFLVTIQRKAGGACGGIIAGHK